MIVRIMGEGQYRLSDYVAVQLNAIDALLEADLASEQPAAFTRHLEEMAEIVRRHGDPLEAEELAISDAIVPPPSASLDEIRQLLKGSGLVPG